MKLTKSLLQNIILEVLKEEEPTKEKKPTPPPSGGGDDGSKELKINIPDSPFNPDTKQVAEHLLKILKQWEIKEYPSDKARWKSYYLDIAKFIKKIKGEMS